MELRLKPFLKYVCSVKLSANNTSGQKCGDGGGYNR